MGEKYKCELFRGTQFEVQKDFVRCSYNLWIVDRTSKQVAYATNIEFKAVEEGSLIPEPVLSLDDAAMQDLMDKLWKAGVRPSEVGITGQLSAVQYHLEDMRKLVFRGKK